MTMNQIQYNPNDYELIRTQEMEKDLVFKLVRFSTGYYGVLSYNPLIDSEQVILLSSNCSNEDKSSDYFTGIGCQSFLIFANDAKKYIDEAPLELVVRLGSDAAEEYREVITREQGETLYEKVGICYEIMNMKIEDSFIYKYGDFIQVALISFTAVMCGIVIMNTLHLYGMI